MRISVSEELSFALYSAANRVVRLHKPFLEPLNLTFPQYLVMLQLLSGGAQTVGVLGAKLDMDAGTITPLLKRMENAGLVSRRRDPDDERRVVVSLDEVGLAISQDVTRVSGQIKSACRMTGEDLVELRDTLNRLARSVGE